MKIKISKVQLISSTICQLNCPTCKTTDGVTNEYLGSQVLKFQNFKKFIDRNPGVKSIELAGQGEIFLNPDVLKIIKYAYEKDVALGASAGSNLNTMSEELLEGLVKYKFSLVSCSIDGASAETYKIYRRGGDFDRVISNIKKINEFKVKYRSRLPILRWSFVLFGHNEHEILLAKRMASQLSMGFRIKIAWGDFSPVKNKALVRKITGFAPTSREEYRKQYGKVYLSDTACLQMWIQPKINPDGRVLGCCMNHWGDYGNVFERDLTDILNGEKMSYARSMLLRKKKERNDIPCVQCPWYHEMKATNSWWFSSLKEKSHGERVE